MDIENELAKMLQEEIGKALKETPIGYNKDNDCYHIGDAIFVDEKKWREYSAAKKKNPELTPKEFQLAEFKKICENFLKEKDENTLEAVTTKYVGSNEKHAKDMDFGEIMNLLKEKEFESIQFKRINKPFDSWAQFFEEYASGEEIFEQWMGIHEFTFMWKGQEKYPFAHAFPKSETEDGYYFYIKQA